MVGVKSLWPRLCAGVVFALALLAFSFSLHAGDGDLWCWGQYEVYVEGGDRQPAIKTNKAVNLQLFLRWNGESYSVYDITDDRYLMFDKCNPNGTFCELADPDAFAGIFERDETSNTFTALTIREGSKEGVLSRYFSSGVCAKFKA